MKLEWWQGAGGWALTTGLAAVAALTGIVELLARHRTRPTSALEAQTVGTQLVDGVTHTIVQVVNSGTGRAAILQVLVRGVVDGQFVFPNGEYRIPPSLGSGAGTDLLLAGAVDENSHVVLVWHTVGRWRIGAAWYPLAAGPLQDEWEHQVSETAARSRRWRVRERARARRRRVGPGGVSFTATPPWASRGRRERWLSAIESDEPGGTTGSRQ